MNSSSNIPQANGETLVMQCNTNYTSFNDVQPKSLPNNKLNVTDNDSFHAILQSTSSSLECMNMNAYEPMNISPEHYHSQVPISSDTNLQNSLSSMNFQCPRKLSGTSAFVQVGTGTS